MLLQYLSFNLAVDLKLKLHDSHADSCPFTYSEVNVLSYVRCSLFLLLPVVYSGLVEVILCLSPQFL